MPWTKIEYFEYFKKAIKAGPNKYHKNIKKQDINSFDIYYDKYPEEAMKKHIIPFIVKFFDLNDPKPDEVVKKLDIYLQDNKITGYIAPQREIITKALRVRRMDSWSRLLAPSHDFSPCVAIAFYDNEFIVSSNYPFNKKERELIDFLSHKMMLILEFFRYLKVNKDNLAFDLDEKKQVIIKSGASLKADITVSALKKFGGYGSICSSHENRTEATFMLLKKALCKLGVYYIRGVHGCTEDAFSSEEIDAIENCRFNFILPNMEFLRWNQNVHAEQLIVYFAKIFKETIYKNSKTYIGISKLCCLTCKKVLEEEETIVFTGTHGQSFPNTVNVFTLDQTVGDQTLMQNNSNPDDSDTDVEYDNTSPDDPDNDFSSSTAPSLDELTEIVKMKLEQEKSDLVVSYKARIFMIDKEQIEVTSGTNVYRF